RAADREPCDLGHTQRRRLRRRGAPQEDGGHGADNQPTREGIEPIGFEESYQLGWRKGGPVRIVIARAKYLEATPEGPLTIATTPLPPRTFPRSLAAPSLLAKILVDKYC